MKKRFGGALSKFRVSARGGRLSLRAWLVLTLALLALVALPASINLAVQEPSEITFAVIGDFGANADCWDSTHAAIGFW